ncbi:MAG: DUF2344 domain-containing protein [Anaerolineaceae bacterium]|nr:DUF2344 domain-containing protein [Anaerolineaceae bacterium]
MRIQITYEKNGSLKYSSSLDMHKSWERTFRRAKLPIAYSQGFHPHPRINQALPLALGFTGSNEIIEIWLETELELSKISKQLVKTVPEGINIKSIDQVPDQTPKIQKSVIAVDYCITLLEVIDIDLLKTRVDQLLSSEKIIRTRRNKEYDLRPLIESIETHQENDQLFLKLRLTAQASATGRPDEVLLALQIDPHAVNIDRSRIILQAKE